MSLPCAAQRPDGSVRRHSMNRGDNSSVVDFMPDVLKVKCSPVIGNLLVTTVFKVTTG